MYPEWDTGTMLDQKLIWEAMSSQYANGAGGNYRCKIVRHMTI